MPALLDIFTRYVPPLLLSRLAANPAIATALFADLGWALLSPWRALVAQIFDTPLPE